MYKTLVSVNGLRDQLTNPDWVIVDCRADLTDPDQGRRDYRAGHIAGAVYADLHTELSGPRRGGTGRHPLPDTAALQALFSRLGIDTNTQVVVYDDCGGGFAARLWWLLRYLGHEAVALLDGGLSAWQAAQGLMATGDEQRPARSFTGTPRPDQQVELRQLSSVPLLIDSRDPARYRGEFEPLDPAAGHIPGARNRFWKQNLGANDRFRPAPELATEFQQLLAGTDPASSVFYCGSGVTACHNILAAVHAGLPQPCLYPGSWSEWCADPARPIATGEEHS